MAYPSLSDDSVRNVLCELLAPDGLSLPDVWDMLPDDPSVPGFEERFSSRWVGELPTMVAALRHHRSCITHYGPDSPRTTVATVAYAAVWYSLKLTGMFDDLTFGDLLSVYTGSAWYADVERPWDIQRAWGITLQDFAARKARGLEPDLTASDAAKISLETVLASIQLERPGAKRPPLTYGPVHVPGDELQGAVDAFRRTIR